MTGPRTTDTSTAMLHAIDERDWDGVRAAFADRVDVDYRSLFGEPAATLESDQLVGGWRSFAEAFDATQHITGPFLVTESSANRANAHTHIRAYHYVKGAPGGDVWIVAGHYEVGFRRIGDGWKIAGVTLRVFAQEGNLAIPERGRARLQNTKNQSN